MSNDQPKGYIRASTGKAGCVNPETTFERDGLELPKNVPQRFKVRVHFYKAEGTRFDRLIRWWTRSPYSHVELELSEGEWWSSSPRDGGVRTKRVVLNPYHWDTVALSAADADALRSFFKQHEGTRYDAAGLLLTQIFKTPWRTRTRFFCSEICAYALGVPDGDLYSPGDLYNLLRWQQQWTE